MKLQLISKTPRRRRPKPEPPEDPIVAFELYHYMASYFYEPPCPMLVVLSSELQDAKAAVYTLKGPYTTKDFDIRSVTRSEREAMKKRCSEK